MRRKLVLVLTALVLVVPLSVGGCSDKKNTPSIKDTPPENIPKQKTPSGGGGSKAPTPD